MTTIEAGGREFTVSGDPTMGTVKHVQQLEMSFLQEHLDDADIMKLQELDSDEEAFDKIFEQVGVDEFLEINWDQALQEPLQTICLATDEKLTGHDIEKMKALEYKKLLDESRDALDGGAADFMKGLQIGISSQMKEAQEMMEERQSSTDTSDPLMSVSEPLGVPSREKEGTQSTTSTQ